MPLATLGPRPTADGDDMPGAGASDFGRSDGTMATPDDGLIGPRHRSVQRLRRLARRRAARTEDAAFVVDGPTLIDEALRAGVGLDEVIAEPSAPRELLDRCRAAGATVRLARPGTLARATDPVQPQAVAAVVRLDPASQPADVDAAVTGLPDGALVMVMVGANDPGNGGTVLRSAEAAGAALVAFCDGSVDPYNPKCVRGSAGSLFRVPVLREATASDLLTALRGRGVRSLGTVARGGLSYDQVDLASGGIALVLGSESHGLPPELASRLDGTVSIPMEGRVESLNLAMAATILCFEAQRQRRNRGSGPGGPGGRNRLDATTDAGAGCESR